MTVFSVHKTYSEHLALTHTCAAGHPSYISTRGVTAYLLFFPLWVDSVPCVWGPEFSLPTGHSQITEQLCVPLSP